MDMTLLIVFIVLNALNVVIQTVKSIVTIKCGKWGASITNAIAYGLYTVVVVYMVCDLPLLLKAFIIGACNLIGVFIVKLVEEKMQKDKLWKVEMTVPTSKVERMEKELTINHIPFNTVHTTSKWTIFNIYCATKRESHFVKSLADHNRAKYFATETKSLV